MNCVIIDCDPGLDDAVALLAALGGAEFEILAITTVAGNVKGEQTAENARIIREAAGIGSTIPIYAGAPRPMFRDPVTAEDFHGTMGLGDLPFPSPQHALSPNHAVNIIIRACRAAQNAPITLIMTGPMTNLAIALTMAPEIRHGIHEVVLMGGADSEGGNITPFAEFNVYADPHAASLVFKSDLNIRCLSLDVTHQLRTSPARLEKMRAVGTRQSRIAADLMEASCKLEFSANGDREAPLHDPSTIVAVTCPHLFEGHKVYVDVVTEPNEQFGRTVRHVCDEGNVTWYESADSDRVFGELCRLLGGYQ